MQRYPEINSRCRNKEDRAAVHAVKRIQLEAEQKWIASLCEVADFLEPYGLNFPRPTMSFEV